MVLDGWQDPVPEIRKAPTNEQKFLGDQCTNLLQVVAIEELIECHLGGEGEQRRERLLKILQQIASQVPVE